VGRNLAIHFEDVLKSNFLVKPLQRLTLLSDQRSGGGQEENLALRKPQSKIQNQDGSNMGLSQSGWQADQSVVLDTLHRNGKLVIAEFGVFGVQLGVGYKNLQ
jgi:hypothetical protein